ncbi:unnamed protein product [Ectocarpus sp. 4 AP-2014]
MGNVFQASYIDVHEAAQSGHIDEVRRWVDEGKPVDARDNTQKTPLHHAAQWGQEEALDFLIECGADVNAADFISDTPLHLACYFGHANCARILIMVGANIAANDCYGNTPSQIFDDHVTEPVLDEIRFIVREVMKGPRLLPEPGPDLARPSSDAKQHPGGNHHRQSSYSTAASPGPPQARKESGTGQRPVEGGRLSSEPGATVEGATPRVKAVPYTPLADGGIPPRASSTALQAGLGLDRKSDVISSPIGNGQNASSTPLSGSSGLEQLEQQEKGRVGGDDRAGEAGIDGENVGATAVEGAAVPSPLDEPSGPGSLAPRLRLKLPWEDEASPEQARREGSERPPEGAAAGASGGGNASARMVGEQGTAATGLTYPGPRPLSAPSMRPMISASRLNATTPILSGRSYQGHNVVGGKGESGGGTLGASGSLGRTGAATLAGRLVAYATRPGGSLDIFAAARDGQVSVLKQALTDGEKVDAQDENGLTALMSAARAGRLSTAKYLVSQGASLTRRDDATGFSPLHFAASSVVRVLVLAGADTQAMDNAGKVPGERFQAVSYLSYKAFHHRRLIGRFLTGNMKDGMDDKGKTMFPKNSPLEAYDEEHRPQCVRLGSSENLAISDQGSTEEDERPSKHGSNRSSSASRYRSRSRPDSSTSSRRASADIARRAYATMQTMHSGVDDGSMDRERGKSEVSRGGDAGDSKPAGGVRYYLRRGSLQQAADKTREMMTNRQEGTEIISHKASTSNRSRSSSRPVSGGGGSKRESGVSFYLRRASLHGVPFLDGFLSGSSKNQDGGAAVATVADSAQRKGTNSFLPGRDAGTDDGTGNGDDQSSTVAEGAAATTVAAAAAGVVAAGAATTAAAAAAGIVAAGAASKAACSGGCSERENVADGMEVGGGRGSRRDRGSVSSGSEPDRRERGGGERGGEGGQKQGVRRLSARIIEGIHGGATELAGQLKGDRVSSGDRGSVYKDPDVELGTRALQPHDPRGEIETPVFPSGLEQRKESLSKSQQQSPEPRQLQQRHQKRESATGAPRKHNQRARIYLDAIPVEDEGGGGLGGASSSLVRPHGGGEGSIPTFQQEADTEEIAPQAEEHHRQGEGDSLADVATSRRKQQQLNRDPLTYSLDNKPNHTEEEMSQGGQTGVVVGTRATSTPTPRGEEGAQENARRNQNAFSADAESEATPTILEPEGADEAKANAKARSVAESPVAVSPAGNPSAAGPTKKATASVGRGEDRFVSQERKETTGGAPAAVVAPPPPSAGDGEEAGAGSGVDSLEPKIHSEDESIGKKNGKSDRKSGSRRKHHHRKHRRHHRHRDVSDDEDQGDGRRRGRRSSRDRLLPGPTLSTTTALAPLKRVPPASLSPGKSAVDDGAGAPSEPSVGFGGGIGDLSGDGGG